MAKPEIQVVDALIVAVSETAGSALYGILDVLAATGTLWERTCRQRPGATAR